MRPLVIVLAGTLAWPAYAQVPLRSDTPPSEPTSPAPAAPMPDAPSPGTPSGTSAPPVEIVEPAPSPPIELVAPPAPRYERRRPNTALLGSGVALFAAGWLADIGFTYGYDHHPASTSLIPIAGPWMQLGQHYGLDGPPINTGSASADANASATVDRADRTIRGLALTGEIVTGLMQAAGLALALAGAITRGKARPIRDAHSLTHVSRPAPLRANGSFLFTF